MSVVTTSTEGGVMTVTLADEENRNALGPDLIEGVLDAVDAADADDDVRVVVLTNRGSVFCAGANLKGGGSARPAGPTGLDLFTRFGRSPKPFVGRIAGHCVAGGMGLAAAMDISVAVETAKMGFTEVRVGVAPAMISVLCLPKMRAADAREAFLRGNRFPASEAARMGIINHAVPETELDRTVEQVVDDLLLGGPAALAATKELTARVPGMSTDEAFQWTARLSAELFAGAEAAEGMAAFAERRRPAWAPPPP